MNESSLQRPYYYYYQSPFGREASIRLFHSGFAFLCSSSTSQSKSRPGHVWFIFDRGFFIRKLIRTIRVINVLNDQTY